MLLTEDMILTRSKQSNLLHVKELNLCGYSLTDVTAIGKLTNVEVLALSVNNIRSLSPFANCRKLKELYLRRNNIEDLHELYYLTALPHLKSLWLIENPFCLQLGFNYRAAVLNILPHIKVLDNVAVSREELDQAREIGVEFDPMGLVGAQAAIPLPEPKTPADEEEPSNVLSAIYTLVKDLDLNGLESLHQSIERRISQIYADKQ